MKASLFYFLNWEINGVGAQIQDLHDFILWSTEEIEHVAFFWSECRKSIQHVKRNWHKNSPKRISLEVEDLKVGKLEIDGALRPSLGDFLKVK